MKYLVTAVWHDGLTNVEEHATWAAAKAFVEEAIAIDGIVTVWVNKAN